MSDSTTKSKSPWAFGGSIQTIYCDVGPPQNTENSVYSLSDHRALPSTAIERVMKFPDNNEDEIVVTTRIRKSVRSSGDGVDVDEEGFFEDDCEVLDFASQRV
jgi:hypothetical protein